MTELPDSGQENKVWIAGDAQIEQVLDGFIGAAGRHNRFPHQAPQYLRDFKIQEVRSVQGLALGINSLLDLLSGGGLKKPVDSGRGIQDNHRAARSSSSRVAVSK